MKINISKDTLMQIIIGVFGIFFLPPVVTFVIGIVLFIASSESNTEKYGNFKLYGAYCFLAGVCSLIVTAF